MIGTYVCSDLNATFVISEATDRNGHASGTFTIESSNVINSTYTVNVLIHYHFQNSYGSQTNLAFYGFVDDPNFYVAGSGYIADRGDIQSIEIVGGFTTNDLNASTAFNDTFTRQ